MSKPAGYAAWLVYANASTGHETSDPSKQTRNQCCREENPNVFCVNALELNNPQSQGCSRLVSVIQ